MGLQRERELSPAFVAGERYGTRATTVILASRRNEMVIVERRFGAFQRSVQLPFEVKEEHVEAKYDKGVPTFRLPKPAELQRPARRIEVRTV